MKLEITLTHKEVENILSGACRADGYNVNTMTPDGDGYLMTYVPEKNGHIPSRMERIRKWLKGAGRVRDAS